MKFSLEPNSSTFFYIGYEDSNNAKQSSKPINSIKLAKRRESSAFEVRIFSLQQSAQGQICSVEPKEASNEEFSKCFKGIVPLKT